MKYSVIVPVFGSEKIIPELNSRLFSVMSSLNADYEIVYVDDCGPGNAWDELQNLARQDTRVTAIQLMRNSGQSSATLCGMAHAQGEIVITIDDDLQNPPEEIPKLLDALAPEIDLVMGVPLMKQHNWFRRLGSQAIHTVNAYMLNRDKDLRFTSFRAIRRPVVNAVLNMRTLNPALGMLFSSVTSRIVNTTVLHSPRHGGRSGYTLSKLLSMTMSNLIGYSMLPLRILGVIGGIGVLSSIVLAAALLVRYLTGEIEVPGWTTTTLLLLFLSGFNFFAFSILGEYLIRILQRVNYMPQYFVRDKIGYQELVDREKPKLNPSVP